MTDPELLREIGRLQRWEREASIQADAIEAAACTVEANGFLAWGDALRRMAVAVRDADREQTRAFMAALRYSGRL